MSEIKERPILFSAPMVRAILEGRKTVTRTLTKVQPRSKADIGSYGMGQPFISNPDVTEPNPICPYGRPGDRLWVRETWYCDHHQVQSGPYLRPDDMFDLEQSREDGELVYAAHGRTPYEQDQPIWKPSINMPRWASRILLEITSVRIERLQDISDAQIVAEGIDLDAPADGQDRYDMCHAGSGADGRPTLLTAWRDLWQSINSLESWDANPWVWYVELKRVMP